MSGVGQGVALQCVVRTFRGAPAVPDLLSIHLYRLWHGRSGAETCEAGSPIGKDCAIWFKARQRHRPRLTAEEAADRGAAPGERLAAYSR